jgi:hypothetical protein
MSHNVNPLIMLILYDILLLKYNMTFYVISLHRSLKTGFPLIINASKYRGHCDRMVVGFIQLPVQSVPITA